MRDKTTYIIGALVIVSLVCAVWIGWSDHRSAAPPPARNAPQGSAAPMPLGTVQMGGDHGVPLVRSVPPPENRFGHLAPRGPEYPLNPYTETGSRDPRGVDAGEMLSANGSVPPARDTESPGRERPAEASAADGGPVE
jgi:hypothetical protein